MKTVLIIAHECAPYNRPSSTIGAQRPYQFAKHLKKFGWQPIVICRNFEWEGKASGDWEKSLDSNIKKHLVDLSHQLSIIIPLASLPSANKIDRIWRSTTLMDSTTGAFKALPNFISSIKRKIASFLKLKSGDYSENWIDVAYEAFKRINSIVKIDLVIAEHGPNASLLVASKIKKNFNISWVIDFRDPLDRDLKALQRKLLNVFLLPKIRTCTHIINVNPYWTEIESKRFLVKGSTIYNGFDEEEFKNSESSTSNKELRIGYFGTIQKPQNILPFIEALSLCDKSFNVKFIYRGASVDYIMKSVSEYNLADSMLDIAGQQPRHEIIKMYTTCDILLLLSLYDSNDKYFSKGLHPGKTFEYMGAKKPILVVPGDNNGLLDSLVLDNKLGVVGRSVDEIFKLIVLALEQKKTSINIYGYTSNMEVINFYTRSNQTRLLAKELDLIYNNESTTEFIPKTI